MATEVVKIVDTGGGGDYSSLAAWQADFGGCTQSNYPSMSGDGDLVGADLIAVADCRCSTGAADTDAVTIDGWTSTGTDNYIKIWTNPDQGYRHDGKWDENAYRLGAGIAALNISESNAYVLGLQIENGMDDNNLRGINIDNSVDNIHVGYCIIRSKPMAYTYGNYSYGIYGGIDATGNRYIYNTIVYDWNLTSTENFGIGTVNHGSGNTYCHNVTIHNCYTGFRDGYSDTIVKNCITQDCNEGFSGSFHSDSDFNCSDISGDAPGANSVTGTVTFVDAANDDFHLDSTDTVARDAGTDLSSDPNLSFTDDIDGETRSAPWDIGADEYVSGGGGQTALFETSLNLAASQQAVGHYSASLTSSVGLTGAQTSLAHLLAALSGSTDLSEQLQALAHLQGQLSSTAHLESQSSGLRHRQGQLTSTTNFQDQFAGLAHLQATLSASLDVSSPITMTASFKGQLSSSLTLTGTFETAGAATALFTSIITLNESLETKASLLTAISDTLTLGATPSALASLKAALTSTFGLSSEFSTQLIMALSATLELGASTEALGHFLASLSDSLIATDSAEVTVHYKLNLSDNLSLGEQITAAASYIMMLTDALGLSALVRDVTVTASGVVTITFNTKNPGVSFSAGCPGATFSGKGSNESFS